mgnify:CR=1 FL=1
MSWKLEMIELMNDYFDKRMKNVIVGCVGRIETHDAVAMRADVKPLLKYVATGETIAREFALLPGIPVQMVFAGGYYIRPKYRRGDLVWVSFSTHAIARGLSGGLDSIDESIFPREGASVAGGLTPNGWTAPDDLSQDGLILGHEDGGAVIRLGEDTTFITGNVEVDGDLAVSGKVEADGEITAMAGPNQVNQSTHTHPYVDTPVGPAATSPPTPGS